MKIKATIQARGVPLRGAYVEHIVWGIGTGMYRTDVEGRIRNKNFEEGIDSNTPNADIRIICQNPILRVLNGDDANIGVFQDKAILDGATVNLNTTAEQDDYFAILNRAQVTYEIVFQPLSFFGNLAEPEFPLGLKASLRDTRDQAKRIDLIYPDHFVADLVVDNLLSFVEPKRLGDDFPLMHIKSRTRDRRLFGEDGQEPTLISHELSHALHFSFLTEAQRGHAQDKYLEFILESPISGVGPNHNFTQRTTPEVAYIEAAGFFGENFMQFVRKRQEVGAPVTSTIQAAFVESEWKRLTTYPKVVAMIPYNRGVITAFSERGIYFSRNGQDLAGGGNTINVYGGTQTVVTMIRYQTTIPRRNGVITAFSGKGIYFSPDGQNLGGGGNTTRVYDGTETVVAMMPYRNGVITAFSGGGIFFSPDGQNLGGGGSTTRVYGGTQTVVAMIPYQNGVITAFSKNRIYFSPDGQNIGGGGNTTRVYDGTQTVVAMIPYQSGVITAFSKNRIYFSPDGQNLGGGGNTIRVYDGPETVVTMIPYRNGVITAFSGPGIDLLADFSGRGAYFSPDGQNLGGGGDITRLPRDLLQPAIPTGGDVEGAVYGVIFVDFASFVGLDFAASSYFQANAITFGQYRQFINAQHPQHSGTLEQVRAFWGL